LTIQIPQESSTKNLVESGNSSEKSESEIMLEDVGAFKVWDCGLKKWIFES
jgi:hypothetical protein